MIVYPINRFLNILNISIQDCLGLTLNCICPVGWGCRIYQLYLCSEVRLPYVCPGYDIKQSDGEVQVMEELCGMRSTPSLPSLPGPL